MSLIMAVIVKVEFGVPIVPVLTVGSVWKKEVIIAVFVHQSIVVTYASTKIGVTLIPASMKEFV